MMKKTEELLHLNLDFLPLKSYTNITEGNALRMDWNYVVSKEELNYIMGNPPFVGQYLKNEAQKDDMANIFGKGAIETKLDYVICWFKKASDFIDNVMPGKIKVAFVSTNSVCQGECVPTFWKYLIEERNIEIQFAYTTFIWDNEATQKANVHCVIVGFSNAKVKKEKIIYSENKMLKCEHINPYLQPTADIWITNRTNIPRNNMPKMTTGSPPTDDGGLLLTIEEKEYFEEKYPILKNYIRPFMGAREFLHDKEGKYTRYCFWFEDITPNLISNIKEINERLLKVKTLREKSNADRIRKMAVYPYLFCQNRQPKTTYLIIPEHSSQNRKYIPIGFIEPIVIASNACSIIPNISIYDFGILTSNVHMAWTKIVCGRLKSDIRYSPAIYNNFPFPDLTEKHKLRIERTAQEILRARLLFPESSLADLYNELTMPKELRKAHQENDKAVMEAYGFNWRIMTESDCVAELMKMYQKLVEENK